MSDETSSEEGADASAHPPPPPPPPSQSQSPPPSSQEASAASVHVAPGWYPVSGQWNVQTYWDGERWAKTRRWQGTAWIEDVNDPAVFTAAAATAVAPGATAAGGPAGVAVPPAAYGASPTAPPYPGVLCLTSVHGAAPAGDGQADGADDQRVGRRVARALHPRTARDRLPARHHLRVQGPTRDPRLAGLPDRRRPGLGRHHRRLRHPRALHHSHCAMDRCVHRDPRGEHERQLGATTTAAAAPYRQQFRTAKRTSRSSRSL